MRSSQAGDANAAAEAIQIAVTRFGLSVEAISLISEGWSDVWKLTSRDREWVLRVSGDERTAASVQYEHRVLLDLASDLPWVVAPLAGIDGETVQVSRGRCCSMFRYVKGRHADVADASVRTSAAIALAHLHAATSSLPRDPRPDYDAAANGVWAWPAARRVLAARDLHSIADDIDLACQRVNTVTAACRSDLSLPSGVVHGDFKPSNLLTVADQVVAVIDWDSTHPDCLAWELAWAVATFTPRADGSCPADRDFRLRRGIDINLADSFLREYRSGGGRVDRHVRDATLAFLWAITLNELGILLDEPHRFDVEEFAAGIVGTLDQLEQLW